MDRAATPVAAAWPLTCSEAPARCLVTKRFKTLTPLAGADAAAQAHLSADAAATKTGHDPERAGATLASRSHCREGGDEAANDKQGNEFDTAHVSILLKTLERNVVP